ncbi:MAG: hypothetical protein HRU11_10520 [Parvularculaceae bacterium]|nr:hypothetical protein [Parvularculaceae bacterium]
MKKQLLASIAAVATLAAPTIANAGLLFKFTEEGGDVVMRASGSIDTSGLASVTTCGWGGVGIETNDDDETDIMGNDLTSGFIDTCFVVNPGTDQSAWLNPGGPFSADTDDFFSDWSVSGDDKPFATYAFDSGFLRRAGLAVDSTDIEGGIWSISQTWVEDSTDFIALGLIAGTYTVTDAVSGEFLTIMVGDPVPIPAAAPLMLAGMAAFGLRKKRR